MMELGFQHSLTYLKASYSPLGLRCSSDGKESACNAGDSRDTGQIPGWGRSPREENSKQPTPAFLPGEFHGPRSLVGYSPWDLKESDMIERLSLSLSLSLPFTWFGERKSAVWRQEESIEDPEVCSQTSCNRLRPSTSRPVFRRDQARGVLFHCLQMVTGLNFRCVVCRVEPANLLLPLLPP